jgi:signal transduction histidine kinase
MQHLFEPFQTTKELTGTGLGLWVSKGIVEKHSGYIKTRSRRGEGHGTVFAVWLPVGGGSNLTAEAD